MHYRKSRLIIPRAVVLGLCALTLGAACSSSHSATPAPTTTNPPTSTTVNPDDTPNSIPYVPGENIGLDHGWLVDVTKVHRPYAPPGMPSAPSGQQYVGVDITMKNQSSSTYTVNAPKVFFMSDSSGKVHDLVPATPAGVGGKYPPGTTRSGRLVFLVPLKRTLLLALDGPLIGTQQSIWTIYPPTVPNNDS